MIDEGTWLVVVRTVSALHHRYLAVKGLQTVEDINTTLLEDKSGSFLEGNYVIESMVKLSDKTELGVRSKHGRQKPNITGKSYGAGV